MLYQTQEFYYNYNVYFSVDQHLREVRYQVQIQDWIRRGGVGSFRVTEKCPWSEVESGKPFCRWSPESWLRDQ